MINCQELPGETLEAIDFAVAMDGSLKDCKYWETLDQQERKELSKRFSIPLFTFTYNNKKYEVEFKMKVKMHTAEKELVISVDGERKNKMVLISILKKYGKY